MPAITVAVSTTRATSSERLIELVRDVLGFIFHAEPHNVLWLLLSYHPVLLACLSICFPLKAMDKSLNPENDTIGILVSTAVDITVGGKTIKPAGGLML